MCRSTPTTLKTSSSLPSLLTLDISWILIGTQSNSLLFLLGKHSCTLHNSQSAEPASYEEDNTAMIPLRKRFMLNYPIIYPIRPIYNNLDYFTTGITSPERHKIRACYYLNTLPPPGDTKVIESIQESLHRDITFDLAQLIKVKPGWMLNIKQVKIVEEHLEKLNQLECCTVCSLIIRNYCQEPSYEYQEIKPKSKYTHP